ncbi:MAG: hypothetical protein DRJ31_02725 [Candidatus Methanomethylicota archaeon]|uniref:PA14 domain-containing protein n=1 Tax=Thermoproteota archaeon TaxID=2056631 RepID=A0A497ERR3_9CREN|nr:MAG: hypothetical protein DRJ31_02725 [Candidatus Verstraetearchaeota archaeon]
MNTTRDKGLSVVVTMVVLIVVATLSAIAVYDLFMGRVPKMLPEKPIGGGATLHVDSVKVRELGCNYALKVLINNTANPSSLSNYQVSVELTSGTFDFSHVKSDGGDIRVFDEDFQELPYWIEIWDYPNYALIWVKVPDIPGEEVKTIYLAYGNPSLSSKSNIDAVMDEGLRYFYYDGTNFNTYKGTDVDTNIDHQWGVGLVSIQGNSWEDQYDTVSIRWTGWVKPKGSGTHTFYVTSDDGDRLYVNNTLIIDQWHDQPPTEYSATYAFSQPVSITVNWYERYGGATLRLGWAPADGTGKVYPIPSSYLRCRKHTSPEPYVSLGEEFEFSNILKINVRNSGAGSAKVSQIIVEGGGTIVAVDRDHMVFSDDGVIESGEVETIIALCKFKPKLGVVYSLKVATEEGVYAITQLTAS